MNLLYDTSENNCLRRIERFALIAFFATGLILRIFRLVEIGQHPEWLVPDLDQLDMGFFYNYGQFLADEIRNRTGVGPVASSLPSSPVTWTQDKDSCFVRPPAYSFFLALVFVLTGNTLMAPIVLQSLMGLINAVLAWRLMRRIGGPFPALLTAAFMLFYWVLIVYEGVYHAQTLMIFLALIFLNALEIWSEKPSLGRAAFTGCFFALHLFASPSAILFMPVAMLWVAFWIYFSSQDWRAAARQAYRHMLAFALGAIVLVAPVTISNWMADGHFTLISTGGGMMLAFGNLDGADGYFHAFTAKQIGISTDSSDYYEVSTHFQNATGKKLTPYMVDKLCRNSALQ